LTIVLAALALLLSPAVSADAEAVEAAASTAPVGEAPLPSEQAPATEQVAQTPAPEAAPQPLTTAGSVETPEAASAGTTASRAMGSADSPASPPVSAPSSSPEIPHEAAAPSVPADLSRPAPRPTGAEATAPPVDRLPQPDRAVAGVARKIARDTTETAAYTGDGVAPVGHLPALPRQPLQMTKEVLQRSLDRVGASGMVEDLLAAAAPSEIDGGAFSPAATPELPDRWAAASPSERAISLGGLVDQHFIGLIGPGGIEPLLLGAASGSHDSAVGELLHGEARVLSPAAGASPGGVEQGSRNFTPPDFPAPADEPPQLGAPVSDAPSFVPIAALLALLALVAPAIDRRRRETPAFSAPTPFVCALERPG
jgi:hypothetical protein